MKNYPSLLIAFCHFKNFIAAQHCALPNIQAYRRYNFYFPDFITPDASSALLSRFSPLLNVRPKEKS